MPGSRAATPQIEGAWVLSDKWTGLMGVALVIKSNDFKYWFYSDVKGLGEPKYPITGNVEFNGDAIRLRSTQDARFYDSVWHVVSFKGEVCLLADKDMQTFRDTRKLPDDRLLYKLETFDEKKPVLNRPRKRV